MLYSYITFPNDVLEKGIKAPVLLEEHQLVHYAQRAGTFKKEGIVEYLETVFKGRSRAISCLTEPVPDLKSRKIQGFKKWRDCFCFSEDIPVIPDWSRFRFSMRFFSRAVRTSALKGLAR